MNGLKRVLILFFAAAFVFLLAASLLHASAYADHVCADADCLICRQAEVFKKLFEGLLSLLFCCLCAAFFHFSAFSNAANGFISRFVPLFLLKTKLSD